MQNRRPTRWGQAVAICAALVAGAVSAQAQEIPQMLPYNGFLADTNGLPVDGTINLTVRIYESSDAVNPIWQEALQNVPVDAGYFRVDLGRIAPLAAEVAAGRTRYLGLSVNGDAEAQPRQAIGAVPYALMAGDSALLGGQPPQAYVSVDRLQAELDGRGLVTRQEVERIVAEGGVDADAVNALIDARGYLSEDAINALIDGRGYLDEAAVQALIDGAGHLDADGVNALIDARNYLNEAAVDARIDVRGYLDEAAVQALILAAGGLDAAAVNALIDGRGYLNEAAILALIQGQGYLTEAAVNALIDGRGYLDAAGVQALIDAGDYLDADAVNALIDARGYVTEAQVQQLVAAGVAQAQGEVAQLQNTVNQLSATVTQLQQQVQALQQNAAGAPFILGRSVQSSNGRFSFGGVNGVQAAHAMCQASFAGQATAHLCSYGEVQRALGAASFDAGNAGGWDNVGTWTLGEIARGAQRNGSNANTCLTLRYNSADAATGTRLTVSLNQVSAGNGGGVRGHQIELRSDIACGQNMPVLCCR